MILMMIILPLKDTPSILDAGISFNITLGLWLVLNWIYLLQHYGNSGMDDLMPQLVAASTNYYSPLFAGPFDYFLAGRLGHSKEYRRVLAFRDYMHWDNKSFPR